MTDKKSPSNLTSLGLEASMPKESYSFVFPSPYEPMSGWNLVVPYYRSSIAKGSDGSPESVERNVND